MASPAVFEILDQRVLGPWPRSFRVTWRHRSRDYSTSHRPFLFAFSNIVW